MKRSYKEEYQYWLDSPALGEEEWKELSAIAEDEKEIESRFFAPLEFGTAGLRGVMATGLNRMNIHVIRWATQDVYKRQAMRTLSASCAAWARISPLSPARTSLSGSRA